MKKSDTLLRHWRMLRDIPRHPRRISTVELLERLVAAGFEATLRTVQRDLVKLSASHPLMSDEAKPQGWSWQANAPQINLPTLEPHAALVFHLAECLCKPARPSPAFNLDEYIASGEFGVSLNAGQNIKLVADFSREAALTFVERPLAADQTVEEVGRQTLRLTAQVPDTLELRRWLLGFGAYAVVLAPTSLRVEMRALVQRMAQSYSTDAGSA